jgi:putative ABC transport system permease protein
MLFNYLKIAFRILTRNKLVSTINILGLALALTGSLLIALFIYDELSYDRYHKNADRIYRVTRNFLSPDGSAHMHLGHLAPPFAPLLKNDFPEIIETTRAYGPLRSTVTFEEKGNLKNYDIENGYFTEPSVFDIFSIEVLSGNIATSLEKPFTMMLSDKVAQQVFGHTDVVGKQISIADTLMEITGTYKTFPTPSHWHPDVLISFNTLKDKHLFGTDKLQNSWEVNAFLTYILVNNASDARRLEQLLPSFIDRHMPIGDDSGKRSASTQLFLQPLTSIHLHSHLDSEAEANGNINHVYVMEAIGIFLVIIACFNFINLATARATERGKEVGLRKVSGALRKQLIFQYIGESLLIVLLAMIVAVSIASMCLPWLNDFTGKSIQQLDYLHYNTLIILVGFVIVVGVIAGLYPAFIISGYKPTQILKGQIGVVRDGGGIRRVLVTVQFSISTVIIIATLIIYQQFEFLNTKDLGYSKDQIVTFRYVPDEHYDAFYNELTQHPAIVDVARSNIIPTSRLLNTNNIKQADNPIEKSAVMKSVSVDQNFFTTYTIPIVTGTDFHDEKNTSSSNGFILNESAIKLLGWTNEEAIGKKITGSETGTIVGIVKDFHFESLHEPIAPIIFNHFNNYSQVSVRISISKLKEGIDHIEKTWKKFVTQEPLKYSFLSDRYNRLYESEASQRELFFIFAILAIFIAALGLFGLATFNTIQRSKEVSIRKVLGASVQSILQLLSKEIIILILVANVIAWPIAWYIMKEWLGEFAYHIEMNVLTYFVVVILTMAVTLITISTQILKAALTNPATMLRSE